MRLLTKNIIFNDQDAFGKMHVVDTTDGVRVLYFGDESQQSRMQQSSPDTLITPYEQVMACWQLFHGQAGNVLLLGLGGGSAAKYCFKQLPASQLTVVEMRESVVHIARQYFALPIDDRITVHIEDGGHFVANYASDQDGGFNLMLVDMYDLEKLYAYIYQEDFLTACLKQLNVGGVLTMNLWSTDAVLFNKIIAALGKVFHWKILIVPVPDSGNMIVFAFHPDAPLFDLSVVRARVAQLEEDGINAHIPWSSYLALILQHNQQQLPLIMHA